MDAKLTIGELAGETGVKVVTIRYYERIGVLAAPARTASNYRSYSGEQITRLRFIRRCRELGFSLQEIRDFLRVSSENGPSCAEICRITEQHLKAIENRIADLKRLASALHRMSSSCSGRRPVAECRILETLFRDGA
ncbi:MAG TPA: helix-turn-helix domain-containing protein [Bryobacteraceae bacterium]|nr:helix-turn-helix domain-containing protein [Bryobacteraceae bacterium]